MRKEQTGIPFWIWYLLVGIPFLVGGFHTYTAMLTAIVFLLALTGRFLKEKSLRIVMNWNLIMVLTIVVGYWVTPLWAADKGMAVYGILRYSPLLFLALLLMQYTEAEKTHFFSLLPFSGAAMIILGCVLWMIPGMKDYVTVNGRLSGFLQYPNTFAAFLLICLALQGTKETQRRIDWVLDAILIAGIFLTGSRTGFLILMFLLPGVAVFRKKMRPIVALVIVAGSGILCVSLLNTDGQITFLGRDLGSLFVRILYYKDALPVILRHPWGLGYMGYRALETTFQTSRYTVSFVHSGLLQMLLDIGWIPALLFVISITQTLFSSKTTPINKIGLLVLSAHALVDFDLQFFLFWEILLLCLDFETGKVYRLKVTKFAGMTAVVPVLAICIWLGIGDWCHQMGKYSLTLKIAPFHTDALVSAMRTTDDPEELNQLADRILALNSTHALAYSAKANAAYTSGLVQDMIRYKEAAIRLTPYTTEEYCDYIEKLYTVLQIYVRNGDTESAAYCVNKLLTVPQMMERVAAGTDPLAYKTGNNSELILPEPYQSLIAELAKANLDY